jgi:hypothetical protein
MDATTAPALDGLDLFDGIASELAAEAEAWLADPARTAHRLVSVPTAELVAEAVGAIPSAGAPEGGMVLPRGLWRVLPDRLLALHPNRTRRTVTVAQHLALTATVLQEWGWAQSGRRIRTTGGRRCILGAQYTVHRLGYGDQHDAAEAGRQIQGALARRGITLDYPHWNELPSTTREQALSLVREAAAGVA